MNEYEWNQKLKNKIKNNDLIITKANKENTMAIIKKEEYNKKSEDFIKEATSRNGIQLHK